MRFWVVLDALKRFINIKVNILFKLYNANYESNIIYNYNSRTLPITL